MGVGACLAFALTAVRRELGLRWGLDEACCADSCDWPPAAFLAFVDSIEVGQAFPDSEAFVATFRHQMVTDVLPRFLSHFVDLCVAQHLAQLVHQESQ